LLSTPLSSNLLRIHAKKISIFTGFFSTRVSITLERSQLFCGLFATADPKNYYYRRLKA
jgi:hypothetical protein